MIKLREIEPIDYEKIVSWIDSRDTLRAWSFSRFNYPFDEAQYADYIMAINEYSVGYPVFVAHDPDIDDIVGSVELRLSHEQKIGFVCLMLVDPQHRKKGYATKIMKQLLVIAFEHYNLHRVELYVEKNNKAAYHTYKKLGFIEEGLVRDCLMYDDEYHSSYIMGMLRSDYQAQG